MSNRDIEIIEAELEFREIEVIDLDLSTERLETKPFEVNFPFRSVWIDPATSDDAEVSLRVNSRDLSVPALTLGRRDNLDLGRTAAKAFLHWTAQAGKTLRIVFSLRAALRSGTVEVIGGIAAIATGTILAYGANGIAPPGYLLCDGAAVSRQVYKDLWNVIQDTFGAGDGVTTFNVPDLRGQFLRGIDDMDSPRGPRGLDAGRLFGSSQADAFQGHYHSVNDPGHNHSISSVVRPDTTGQDNLDHAASGGIDYWPGSHSTNVNTTGLAVRDPSADGSNGAPRTATETRPTNVAISYIIKT